MDQTPYGTPSPGVGNPSPVQSAQGSPPREKDKATRRVVLILAGVVALPVAFLVLLFLFGAALRAAGLMDSPEVAAEKERAAGQREAQAPPVATQDSAPAAPAEVPTAAPLPPGTFRAKGGHVATLTRDKLDKALELVAADDKEAFDKMVKTDPGVFVLQRGELLTLVDTEGVLASVIKVRRRGTAVEVWTVNEALDQ